MPHAANNQISKAPIEGGIEITDEQYREALDHIAAGKMVRVTDGELEFADKPVSTTYWSAPAQKNETEPGEDPPADAVLVPPPDDYHVVEGGQWVYSLEREREKMALSQYQARAALLNAGLLDDVETLMDDENTDRSIRLMWQHKERIRRNHPATVQMAQALGWSDEQLDDLFRAGMEIEP